jgi:7-cyano-7-deazaguanine synthase
MTKKAIIILSGGLDSTTCLAIARSQGFSCYTLSFDYGQKSRAELKAAANLSKSLGAKMHKVFHLPIDQWGGSALTDPLLTVPDYQKKEAEIPITYVPARNLIFLSIAVSWAEVLHAYAIFIGVNAIDYSNYPDCRPAFIVHFQRTINLATKTSIEGPEIIIHTPLIYLSKAEIIQKGLALSVDYSQTVSCYRSEEEKACGKCDSCVLRKAGFRELALEDPLLKSFD